MKLALRPNVCIMLFNSKYELFLGERLNHPGVWQFPQGGAEEGLTLEENVIRELHEETGAAKDLFEIVRKLNSTYEYEFKEPPAYAKGRWRGQTQTFWLVKYLGADEEFRLDRFEPEFMNFCWSAPDEVRSKVEALRLPGYQAPLKEYEEYLRSLS